MPLYAYKCEGCQATERHFRKIDNRFDFPKHDCGAEMSKVIEAPRVQADLPGYTSPIDGRWIEGAKARNEDLKRNDCIPYDTDFRDEVLKKQNELRPDTEAAIDKMVEQTASELNFS